MNGTTVEVLSKLGATGLLGMILWHVLFKVGTGIVAGITNLAAELKAQTAALIRVESKLDHLMDQRRDRSPPDPGR